MNIKEKIDAGLDGIDNVMEFMKNQPKKRCSLIEGHDNYWEGKIEAIKKVIDETLDTPKDTARALNEINKIIKNN